MRAHPRRLPYSGRSPKCHASAQRAQRPTSTPKSLLTTPFPKPHVRRSVGARAEGAWRVWVGLSSGWGTSDLYQTPRKAISVFLVPASNLPLRFAPGRGFFWKIAWVVWGVQRRGAHSAVGRGKRCWWALWLWCNGEAFLHRGGAFFGRLLGWCGEFSGAERTVLWVVGGGVQFLFPLSQFFFVSGSVWVFFRERTSAPCVGLELG
jgi:hypothetical protein